MINGELTDALIINAFNAIGNICLSSKMNDQDLKKVMDIISPMMDFYLKGGTPATLHLEKETTENE